MSSFWDRLSSPWQACLEEAWAAYCTGCTPIGATIAGPDGAIIARGRNRIGEEKSLLGVVQGTALAHAELNALIALPHHRFDPHDLSLYSALEPCPLCLGALYISGVRTLHYAAPDPFAGSVNLLGITPYLSLKPIRVFDPADSTLEQVVLAMQVDYFLRRGDERAQMVLGVWEQVVPASVVLAKRLHSRGLLSGLRVDKVTAAQAYELLASQL